MAATGTTSFSDYFARLRRNRDDEVQHFVNAVTVNETYFYREDYQLRCLTADLLRERLSAKSAEEPIRIWSMPCATGEEPYSIAIWLLENWPEVDATMSRSLAPTSTPTCWRPLEKESSASAP